MLKHICFLIVCLWATLAFAEDVHVSAATESTAPAANDELDSAQMESSLQHLNWEKFRSVIESVPKLKADVDAYGPLGWRYVQANFTTYGWKKNIDRLDDTQKRNLAGLIQAARDTR